MLNPDGNHDPKQTVDGRLYGVYLGLISNREDPEKRGRVKVRLPTVFPNDVHPTWALPMGVSYGEDAGRLIVPEVGAQVFVMFLEGDPNIPVWTHGPFGRERKPRGLEAQGRAYPNELVLHESAGGTSVVEDINGNVAIGLSRNRQLKIEGKGTYMFLDVLPNGKLEINRPQPEQLAARKGDSVDCGSLSVAIGPSGVTAVLWTPPGDPTPIPLSATPTPITGKITTGSLTVKIGN